MATRAGWGPPPARRAGDALDGGAPVSALLAGHRRAQACFVHVRPLLADTLAELVRPGPIDEGTWTLFAEHASAAANLRPLLPEARAQGLAYVEITTDPDNAASQRVIVANGGVLVERFTKPPQFGSRPGLRYRIDLSTLA